jgi:hypothetical protein
MTIHQVMSRTAGDVRYEFDPKDKQAVNDAMARFQDLVGRQKMWAAKPGKNGEKGELVKQFDPHTDVIFMPQLVGG